MKIKIQYILITFFCFLNLYAQEPELFIKVSKNSLSLNERLQVEFSLNMRGADNFEPPNFKDFTPLNTQPMMSTGESVSIINGNVTRKFNVKYTFVIKPKRVGELIIEPASVQIGNKTVKSKPVKITVTKSIKRSSNPNDTSFMAENNVHLVAHVSNTKPYVGESISVEYRIYVKDVAISLLNQFKKPKYNGFLSQDLLNNKDVVWLPTKYKGEDYEYAVLEEALLTPTKDGKLYIGSISMDLQVGLPVKRRDFFGNIFTTIGNTVEQTYTSSKKMINVLPLPIQGKPADFKGAVGNFKFSVELSKKALKANESSQIRVKVSGTGNLKSFKIPEIQTPSELEVFTPERKEKVRATSNGLKGLVTNTYTVVPQYKGKYKIPSSSFSYFDPKKKSYKTIKTDDLIIDVLQGKELNKTTKSDPTLKKDVIVSESNFRYILTKTTFRSLKSDNFFNSITYYIIISTILLIIPLVMLLYRKKKAKENDVVGNKLRRANRLVKKHLNEAKDNLGEKTLFYESLERALHNYLKAKLKIETADMSTNKINEILNNKGIDQESITKFLNVLKSCDFARYTPVTNLEMKSEYDKATEILIELDKKL